MCPYCFNQCVACCPRDKKIVAPMYTYSEVYWFRYRQYYVQNKARLWKWIA